MSTVALPRFNADGYVDAIGADTRLTLDDLALLLRRPAWHADALCPEYPDVSWFPTAGQSTAPAKRVCRRCLCRADCLAWALQQPESPAGVWGGLSVEERRRLVAPTAPRSPRSGPCGSCGHVATGEGQDRLVKGLCKSPCYRQAARAGQLAATGTSG